jgi:glycosyltransferase involved in cell wall biosynthesis
MTELRPGTAGARDAPPARILSLSTEFPNPSEPGKGLFVRARLRAMAATAPLSVIAPIALLDYANPDGRLLAALEIPRHRDDQGMAVSHPRWLYPPYGGWLNAFFLFGRLVWPVTRLKRRGAFDVIDAHFAHPEGIAAALLGAVLDVPIVVTIRGSELRYRQQRLKRYWMAWALRRADRVIAVSGGLRDLAIELGVDEHRAKTIPNGVDASIFFRRDRTASREKYHIAAGERVVLCAGDLAELKGHHRTIAAIDALSASGCSARLLIAGGAGRTGRYADTLKQLVAERRLEDRVRFLGTVPQESLAELMTAADVFCLASSTEGWPNVVNEALACGTPVVATDVGAVRQMIASERDGIVVPVNDVEALAAALRRALTATWDHAAICAFGQARSWSQVADAVLAEIGAALESRARRRDRTEIGAC